MDFILNEKSLHGQFEDVETFLKSLKNNIRCFDIIHRSGKIGFLRQLIFMNVLSQKI